MSVGEEDSISRLRIPDVVARGASGKFIGASGRFASLRHIHGTSVKNGRKLVRRRRKWISLVIPLSPARGKSSRPNEPNATYRRSKREKSTGVSIRFETAKNPLF